MLVSNESENCHKLKESISIKNSQRAEVEKNELVQHGKMIGIDEIIEQNDRINNNNLKSQV